MTGGNTVTGFGQGHEYATGPITLDGAYFTSFSAAAADTDVRYHCQHPNCAILTEHNLDGEPDWVCRIPHASWQAIFEGSDLQVANCPQQQSQLIAKAFTWGTPGSRPPATTLIAPITPISIYTGREALPVELWVRALLSCECLDLNFGSVEGCCPVFWFMVYIFVFYYCYVTKQHAHRVGMVPPSLPTRILKLGGTFRANPDATSCPYVYNAIYNGLAQTTASMREATAML